ncbi:hypothetical protein ABW21_db0206337 [Orbilia brochopaga]|nr:hypothetical protein ABW21_db0206337 [Drechslerella brochopaga]
MVCSNIETRRRAMIFTRPSPTYGIYVLDIPQDVPQSLSDAANWVARQLSTGSNGIDNRATPRLYFGLPWLSGLSDNRGEFLDVEHHDYWCDLRHPSGGPLIRRIAVVLIVATIRSPGG